MGRYDEAKELARQCQRPTALAAELGINVFFVPFKTIKGITFSLGTKKFIMIDSELPEYQREIVCGHEIGHFKLHPGASFFIYTNRNLFLQ